MHWSDIPAVIDDWVEKTATIGYGLRQAAANAITASHVGYYVDPTTNRVGVFAPMATASDTERVKTAARLATGEGPLFLTYCELSDVDGTWVKVAHSPTLRRAGEILNFFPGQYTGGVPNSPSPVASMLTSSLLGAGLGWGAGKLIGKVLPEGYGDRLSRTGLIAGGLVGAAPGGLWGLTNKLDGRRFNDPSLLQGQPGDEPINYPNAVNGSNSPLIGDEDTNNPTREFLDKTQKRLQQSPMPRFKFGEDLEGLELGAMYKSACEKAANTFGNSDRRQSHEADVNIDHLGRTLWDTGASPQLAATIMSGMYAAQQLPDPRSQPGWATGGQLGQLAANAAGDYARGSLAGAAINAVIGTPYRAPVFGASAAVLGVLGAVVPRLMGR